MLYAFSFNLSLLASLYTVLLASRGMRSLTSIFSLLFYASDIHLFRDILACADGVYTEKLERDLVVNEN